MQLLVRRLHGFPFWRERSSSWRENLSLKFLCRFVLPIVKRMSSGGGFGLLCFTMRHESIWQNSIAFSCERGTSG